jgi:hypothetical protein
MRMADALAAVAEEDRPRVQASIDRMLRGARDSFATVVRWHGHDGELHWVETRGEAVRDEDGNVLRIVGTSRLHLSGAEGLAGAEPDDASWCAMLNSFKGHAVVLDERGVVVAVNEAWRRFAQQNGGSSDDLGTDYLEVCCPAAGDARAERLYGRSAAEAVGRRADELMLSAGTSIDPAIGARLAGGRWDGECASRRKDG